MSRKKARKPRRKHTQRPGRVFVQTAHGDTVLMPGVNAEEYRRVKELAERGDILDPDVLRFIRAFADLIGASLDFEGWTDADMAEFLVYVLRWMNFVPEDEWTALDDLEVARMAGGA